MAEDNNQYQPYSRFNSVSLLFQVSLGILIGSFLQGTNGLDCYKCRHSTFVYGDDLINNPECLTPETAKGSLVEKVTCTDPDIACMKGYGLADHSGLIIEILLRRCFISESDKKEPDGCLDLHANVYSNGTIVHDKPAARRSITSRDIMALDSLAKYVAAESNKTAARQSDIDHLHVDGKYCWCDGKDLCNDAPGLKVVDPNSTDANNPTNGCRHVETPTFFPLITTTAFLMIMTSVNVLSGIL